MEYTAVSTEMYDDLVPYFAGFFDGEGSVEIVKSGIRTTVVQLNPLPLRKLRDRYGGDVRWKQGLYPRGTFYWTLTASNAEKFLSEILPHLIVKKDEATLALEFYARVPHSNFRLSNEEREWRKKKFYEIRALRRRSFV